MAAGDIGSRIRDSGEPPDVDLAIDRDGFRRSRGSPIPRVAWRSISAAIGPGTRRESDVVADDPGVVEDDR
jgi:hypothetical protein